MLTIGALIASVEEFFKTKSNKNLFKSNNVLTKIKQMDLIIY